jgi:hypothetical protein
MNVFIACGKTGDKAVIKERIFLLVPSVERYNCIDYIDLIWWSFILTRL